MATIANKLDQLKELYLGGLVDAEYYVKEAVRIYEAFDFSVPPIKVPDLPPKAVPQSPVPDSQNVTIVSKGANTIQVRPTSLTLHAGSDNIPAGCPSPKKKKTDQRERRQWINYTDDNGKKVVFAAKEEAKEFAHWMQLSCQWSNFRANGGSGSGGTLA